MKAIRYFFLGISIFTLSMHIHANNEQNNIFAECDVKVVQTLYQMLLDVHDLCTTFDIPYWIDSGTLLGAVRHKGLIPWDDDLDLCIFEEDEAYFLKVFPFLQHLGYDIVGMPFGYKIYPVDGVEVQHKPWKHPGCDIFIMQSDGTQAFYKHRHTAENSKNFDVDIADILPLRTYMFGPMLVLGPRNPLPYLYNWYGDDYLTIAYKDYDHGAEKQLKKSVKILSEKADFAPALPADPLQHNITPIIVKHWPCDFYAMGPKEYNK